MSRSQILTPAAAAVLVAVVLLLPGLGGAPLDDPGEGQHAEIAREISTGGGWVTLRLNGVRYFDKPPLLYWLTAASFRLFGTSEWAARLAPLLGALLAVAATAVLGARLLGPRGGVIAAGALLSSALFLAFGRYLRPETLFVGAIQLGFTGLDRKSTRLNSSHLVISYAVFCLKKKKQRNDERNAKITSAQDLGTRLG